MKLYIKSVYVQQRPGLIVYNDVGEKKYTVSIEHSVLGMKLDLHNADGKRVSKIRQHGFSFNKTYNISAGDKNLKLILKVDEDNISAFINGYPIVIAGDILKKDFSLLGESKSVIMLHKYNLNHYYELDILRKDFELLSICVSLCIETLLFFDEKKSKKEKNFFTKYILNNKKVFGSLRETFSTNVKNEK
ncbi:MAG: hypothetical protein V8P98_04195 [Acutalibacteraceae bacterium]|jgi:uncharacterized protein YxjI